jgi:hypothetical protein
MASDYRFGQAGGVRGSTPYTPDAVEWLSRELASLKRDLLRVSNALAEVTRTQNGASQPALTSGRWKFEERAGVFGVLYVPTGIYSELAP